MNSYTKTTWIDNSTPAINAENLNHIEQGIKDVTDEVIGGTVHVVAISDNSDNAADSCIEPNTLYYVRVVSSVVAWGKMYLICTPEISATHVKSQIAFSMDGYLITRICTNDVWGDWVKIPFATEISTMIQNAISGKANISDVYTKTQANETFVDKTTYNTDLGEIDEQLLQTEDTANKVTQITGNETNAQYPSAPAVVAYVNAAIAAALNGQAVIPLSETIIIALISLLGTLGGTFGGILATSKLTNYRIEQLEKQVAKHNNLVERMYKAEDSIHILDEKIKTANHRIEDLENGR